MKIKFIGKDPRAGMVAQMDSSRGQELIDAGCAVQIGENEGATSDSAPSGEGGKADTKPTREDSDNALASLPAESTEAVAEVTNEKPAAEEKPAGETKARKGKGG
ncbi:hypothetical protein C7416_102213 [Cupriavidus phytorum]|uniref:Uncharacterized protein n=1 Tax=Cupriavidus phytorum TaxID=3024399 RepID=A0A2W7P9I7_9BURK|nr:hypothetical protein [Cupriavidus alkaliphilus]PZX32053.1 hypothetical protein C7416_102213 [Cupriavidus alkaliphilus]